MEELRSTEILDREIQEDARRKAEKILKTCDAECRSIRDDVVLRMNRMKGEKEEEYRNRLEAYRTDVLSSIPLEKQRRLVSFIDTAVQEAFTAWFSALGTDRKLAIYQRMMERYGSVLENKKVAVTCIGYETGAVSRCVSSIFGSDRILSVTAVESSPFLTDGILVSSEDGTVQCRASFEQLRQSLLDSRRQEMAEALMGGRLPE